MNIEDFLAGHWVQQYQYKSFIPEKINHEWIWQDPVINTLLEDATKALGELNAFTGIVPNVDLFISMHITKEANTSSRIEGTKTEIDEALMEKESLDPEKRDDWQEVQNYISAMNGAIEELKTLPVSNRLIKNTHRILMENVRGENKQPGEFRQSQNWIGGSNLKTAFFIPPPHTEVPELMSDLEKFLHNDEIHVPRLIKIAIAHYQFETIHPFLDGNGRIGRLLITLFLVSNDLLKKPSLYLSDFFERNKGSYYDALTLVRTAHDLNHWVRFFLTAIIETAQSGVETFKKILDLKQRMDASLFSFGKKAQNVQILLDYLYKKPIINVKIASEVLGVTKATANSLIKDLEAQGVLNEITGYQRNKWFVFSEYLSIFDKHK